MESSLGVMIFIILMIVFVFGGIVFVVVDGKKRRRQEKAKRQEQAKYILDHHGDVLQKFAMRRFQGREGLNDMANLVRLLMEGNPSLEADRVQF